MKCKRCQSENLRRYGTHNGVQLYICRSCGLKSRDNDCDIGMRYPRTVINTFIENRKQGKTLSQIKKILFEKFGVNLSTASLYKWERKYQTFPPVPHKGTRIPLGKLKEIANRNKGRVLPDMEIKSLFGYSQATKMEDTQLIKLGIIRKENRDWKIKK